MKFYRNNQFCNLKLKILPGRLSWMFIPFLFFGVFFSESFFKLRIFEEMDGNLLASAMCWAVLAGAILLYRGRLAFLLNDYYFICILIFMLNLLIVDYFSATLLYDQPVMGAGRDLFRHGVLLVYPILFLLIDKRLFFRVIRALSSFLVMVVSGVSV